MDINERLDKLKKEKSLFEAKLKQGIELYMNIYIPDILKEINNEIKELTQKLKSEKFKRILKKIYEPNTKQNK